MGSCFWQDIIPRITRQQEFSLIPALSHLRIKLKSEDLIHKNPRIDSQLHENATLAKTKRNIHPCPNFTLGHFSRRHL